MDKSILDSKEYEFLKTNENLGDRIILIGLGGSYAYGTNVEGSDIDIRGVAMNSADNILVMKDFEQVVEEKTDTTIYSFDKMISLLANCNPNTIEILGLDEEDYLYLSDTGKSLLDHSKLFLSKRCVRSFAGYANQQLYRLQQKTLCVMSKEDYNAHTARVLKSMVNNFQKKFGLDPACIRPYVSEDGDLMLDLNFVGLKAVQVSSMLSELNDTIRDYYATSKRNKRAETHGKIAKHSMHLIRLYLMAIDILINQKIVTKRKKEHDFLIDIRNGKYLDENDQPKQEFFNIVQELELEFEAATKATKLPDNPDMDKINKYRRDINYDSLCRDLSYVRR